MHILALRDGLPARARHLASATLTERLFEQPEIAEARTILAYASFGSEFETRQFLEAILGFGKQLALPRVNRDQRSLNLFLVTDLALDLDAGIWGIPEPRPDRCTMLADLRRIDAVLVPGVAFSHRCERLGYGGGYYDKLLSRWDGSACLIAAAYDLQLVESLPVTSEDVSVDRIVTPTKTLSRPS